MIELAYFFSENFSLSFIIGFYGAATAVAFVLLAPKRQESENKKSVTK